MEKPHTSCSETPTSCSSQPPPRTKASRVYNIYVTRHRLDKVLRVKTIYHGTDSLMASVETISLTIVVVTFGIDIYGAFAFNFLLFSSSTLDKANKILNDTLESLFIANSTLFPLDPVLEYRACILDQLFQSLHVHF
jgi:hypothetical protein